MKTQDFETVKPRRSTPTFSTKKKPPTKSSYPKTPKSLCRFLHTQMACCDILFCFSGDPVEDDPRASFANKFKVNMLEAPSHETKWFLYGCCCLPCSQFQLRQYALAEKWPAEYSCCQGYLSCCGFNPSNKCGEKSMPELCLCMEVCCCPGCSVSATRMYVLDKFNIVPDPMDNKIMRFNNCVQLLACVIDILAIFISELREASDILNMIAQLVFHLTVGCMSAQMYYELFRGGPPGSGVKENMGAPELEKDGMVRE